MDPHLITAACELYEASPSQLIPLSGGHSNAVYRFPLAREDGYAVLRIGVEDCPLEQTLAMLEWVRYIKQKGAPVSGPLPSIHGRLMESLEHDGTRYIITVFEKAGGILAEDIPPGEWTGELFQNIGRAVGRFHRHSKGYVSSSPSLTRPHWFESFEIQKALKIFSLSSDPARDQLTRLIGDLKLLPTPPEAYGLIHDDLHFANFLVTPDHQVTIIDFDDCGYGWFVIDVAMALFDVLVLYDPANDGAAQTFARHFMTSYLQGYRSEYSISSDWLVHIPALLKLKELCIYPTLIGHPEISQPHTWVGRFMRNRAYRIAANIPYVGIDFSQL